MEKAPTYSAPDQGRLNQDLSNLGVSEKYAKGPINGPENDSNGMTRRGFLKIMGGAIAAVALGKGLKTFLDSPEAERNEKLVKLDEYLSEQQTKIHDALKEIENHDNSSSSDEELKKLIYDKNLCSTALLQIIDLKEQIQKTSNDLKPEEMKKLNHIYIPLHKTLQLLEIEAQDNLEEPDKAINAIINI